MDRSNDFLIPSGTRWLNDPNAQAVCAAVQAGGFDIYFVGGCVRNALLGQPESDVDMSTNAVPEMVLTLARDAGLRAIPTGMDHGTITVVAGGSAFEITTFRRDVATDGRRAVVAFSDDIVDDAKRRDFTMNALYATPDGRVVDPLGGLPDLLSQRVRFIENPSARIQEDYLRILRFFRFSAHYAAFNQGFDADTLAEIADNMAGLETLSAERVGQEIRKLLAAVDPAPAVAAMRQIGVLTAILPGSDDQWLAPLIHLEGACNISADWRTRLAVLGGQDVVNRLRLSRVDARQHALCADIGFVGPSLAEVAYRHGADIAQQVLLMRYAFAGEMPDLSLFETISDASRAHFPIAATDLMPAYQGPALGARLSGLERRWIDSGFKLTRDDLLNGP
jgi:poly(A) polymerase/tRNA nucleotidyltransferase (CCA-adding enzyme)